MNDQQSAFEAWQERQNPKVYPAERQAFEAGWQAALKSPEVEALRKDSQRLSAIESDEGADIIRLSSDEWEVSGYEKNLYGTGRTLREAIDNAIKEAEMNTSKNHQEIDASSERVDEIKLPPLPSPFGIVDPVFKPKNPFYDVKDLQDYAMAYARAAIEADRQARGEPAFFTYLINGHHRGISETEPPDDSYDEGTLQKLYATPQQTRASCQGKNCGATNGQSHSSECIVEAATAQGWAGSPEAIQAQQEIDSMNRATPQPQQIPEGYKLVPVEPTEEMVKAARKHHESDYYLPRSLYKAMLEAAPHSGE